MPVKLILQPTHRLEIQVWELFIPFSIQLSKQTFTGAYCVLDTAQRAVAEPHLPLCSSPSIVSGTLLHHLTHFSQANSHQHRKTFKRKRQNLPSPHISTQLLPTSLSHPAKHFKSMVSTFSPPIHSSVHYDLTSAQSFIKIATCKEPNGRPVKSKEQFVYYPTCHLPKLTLWPLPPSQPLASMIKYLCFLPVSFGFPFQLHLICQSPACWSPEVIT